MVRRLDIDVIRLARMYNELVERQAMGELPVVLQGAAIPNQILEHSSVLMEKRASAAREREAREAAREVFDQTGRYLDRLHRALLSAYDDPSDGRLAALGVLGVSPEPEENQRRLAHLAEALRGPLAAGELVLEADLWPDALAAHAARHQKVLASEEVASGDGYLRVDHLSLTRRRSREMLQLLKAFVRVRFGAEELPAFGFDAPLRSTRRRLRGKGERSSGERSPAATGT